MLAALLLIAPQAVDYSCVARPLESVLAELSDRTGVRMRPSEAVADKLVVIDVRNAHPLALRNALADVVSGKWEERDGVLLLSENRAEVDRRYAAWVQARADRLRSRIRNNRMVNIGFTDQQMQEAISMHGNLMHSFHSLGAILERTDIESLAVLKPGERLVLSTRPTRLQRGISGCEDILKRVLDTQTRIAQVAREVEVDEPPVGTPQYLARQRNLATWSGPLRAVIIAEGEDEETSFRMLIADATGKVVDTVHGLYGSEPPKEPEYPAIPDGVAPNTLIDFSPAAKALAGLTSQEGAGNALVPNAETDAAAALQLRTPTKHDPLSFHLSEGLQQFAGRTGRQLVACVSDEMIVFTRSKTWTLQSVQQEIFTNRAMAWSEKDGWLTVRPSNPKAPLADRRALENFITATPPSEQSLADVAEYAWHVPAPWSHVATLPYHRIFAAGLPADEIVWPWLKAYHAMSQAERLRAPNGIALAELSAPARRALEQAVFFSARSSYLLANGPMYPGSEETLAQEPTEAMPLGLPAQGVLKIAVIESPAVFPEPERPGIVSLAPMSVNWLAVMHTMPSALEGRDVSRFKLGKELRSMITCRLTPEIEYSVRLGVYERSSDKAVYTVHNAPEDFRKAFNEALERQRSRGGGG